MNRKQYTAALLSYMMGTFLPELAEGNPAILAELERCRCKINGDQTRILIEFQLANFFDALWHFASSNGLNFQTGADWEKDFKEFCDQLMNPWPIEKFAATGFEVRPIHKSSNPARCVYEFACTQHDHKLRNLRPLDTTQ